MKLIIKTSTQKSYNKVLEKLEKDYPDLKWVTGDKPSELDYWEEKQDKTILLINDDALSYGYVGEENWKKYKDSYKIQDANDYLKESLGEIQPGDWVRLTKDYGIDLKEGEVYEVVGNQDKDGIFITVKHDGDNSCLSPHKENMVKIECPYSECNNLLSEKALEEAPGFVPAYQPTPNQPDNRYLDMLTFGTAYSHNNNLSTKPKIMSSIKQLFQSKESKAINSLNWGENSKDLNQIGLWEFLEYLYETEDEARKDFLKKAIEISKE